MQDAGFGKVPKAVLGVGLQGFYEQVLPAPLGRTVLSPFRLPIISRLTVLYTSRSKLCLRPRAHWLDFSPSSPSCLSSATVPGGGCCVEFQEKAAHFVSPAALSLLRNQLHV